MLSYYVNIGVVTVSSGPVSAIVSRRAISQPEGPLHSEQEWMDIVQDYPADSKLSDRSDLLRSSYRFSFKF
jgi:hypothetical protein